MFKFDLKRGFLWEFCLGGRGLSLSGHTGSATGITRTSGAYNPSCSRAGGGGV